MPELSKGYLLLFNAITDAEISLQKLRRSLVTAQQTAEEIYISIEDHSTLLDISKKETSGLRDNF